MQHGSRIIKKKQEGHDKKRKVNYDKMSDANKERVKEAVLASMGIRTNPDNPSMGLPSSPSKKPLIFVINVPVLSSSTPSRAIMPAPIMSNFPHIRLQLGSTLDCADCPVLHCVVDAAAALTTGNFHFVAPLAKKYLHCVPKLYVLEEYNPHCSIWHCPAWRGIISHDRTNCGISVSSPIQDLRWSGHQYSHCHWSPRHS
jgi:hypothetical protein